MYVKAAPFLESPYYLRDFKEISLQELSLLKKSSYLSSSKQIIKKKPETTSIRKSSVVSSKKVLSAKDLKKDVEKLKKAVGGKFLKY